VTDDEISRLSSTPNNLEKLLAGLCCGKIALVGPYQDRYRLHGNKTLQCAWETSPNIKWHDVPQPYHVMLHIGLNRAFYRDGLLEFEEQI